MGVLQPRHAACHQFAEHDDGFGVHAGLEDLAGNDLLEGFTPPCTPDRPGSTLAHDREQRVGTDLLARGLPVAMRCRGIWSGAVDHGSRQGTAWRRCQTPIKGEQDRSARSEGYESDCSAAISW